MATFWDWIAGTPSKIEQSDILNPQQKTASSDVLKTVMSALPELLQQQKQQFQPIKNINLPNVKPFDFGPIEQEARTQFAQQTVPSIAERFTGMGGGQRSSAFGQTLGAAGSGLEQVLASLKSSVGLQQQAQKQGLATSRAQIGLQQNAQGLQQQGLGLQQQQMRNSLITALLGQGLSPQFQSIYRPREQGFVESAIGPALQALMLYLSGGASAALPNISGQASNFAGTNQGGYGQGGYGQGFANPSFWNQNLSGGF